MVFLVQLAWLRSASAMQPASTHCHGHDMLCQAWLTVPLKTWSIRNRQVLRCVMLRLLAFLATEAQMLSSWMLDRPD